MGGFEQQVKKRAKELKNFVKKGVKIVGDSCKKGCLDLIAKVHGQDQAEKCFNSISDDSIDFNVYSALLNCSAQHNSVEKLDNMKQEMIGKNKYDTFTLRSRLNAYATAKDINAMEKLLMQMEAAPVVTVDWLRYSIAANCYVKADQFVKSDAMLKKPEQLVKGRMRNAYVFLVTMYAAIEKVDDIYRVWSMLSTLVKLNDMDGPEKIFEKWESGNTCFDIRIPNVMISVDCKNGLMEKSEAYIERLLEGYKEKWKYMVIASVMIWLIQFKH
ncbi:hypothetical protein TanjilG_03049 [Lupinus angustifolius]|uniref:Pentacotripeptide-repeat region of PRORP domain-containing protein n=1 Tax=Lupinus angustifolius TaxID=3871 RepID=A0A4P1RCY1_LUPAN|nr:PREDICTED: pentatricopeptide repeat-containing protein At2g20710, mitochondrial-like [Lupinus angustifolius]OIW08373.1 hypothetical protein TanjilG_03049 [Lupinus angustifolius]